MNTALTEIAYILDRSGSMQPLQEAAISGFNDFLRDQLDVPGDARLTLVLFDDEYLMPVAAKPIEEVPRLDATTYVPRASTALLDAIGETIDALGKRLEATDEAERPGKVLVVIFTDGLENASRRYRWSDIAERIRHQRDKYGWEFIFLGANQDAIATAAQLNVDRLFTSGMDATPDGLYAAKMAVNRKVRSMRHHSMGINDGDFAKSVEELVNEESKPKPQTGTKRRGGGGATK